jgi:hypothetical protein
MQLEALYGRRRIPGCSKPAGGADRPGERNLSGMAGSQSPPVPEFLAVVQERMQKSRTEYLETGRTYLDDLTFVIDWFSSLGGAPKIQTSTHIYDDLKDLEQHEPDNLSGLEIVSPDSMVTFVNRGSLGARVDWLDDGDPARQSVIREISGHWKNVVSRRGRALIWTVTGLFTLGLVSLLASFVITEYTHGWSWLLAVASVLLLAGVVAALLTPSRRSLVLRWAPTGPNALQANLTANLQTIKEQWLLSLVFLALGILIGRLIG